MRAIWLCLAAACVGAAPSSESMAQRAPPSSVPSVGLWWTGDGPYDGQPSEVRVRVYGFAPGARVAVVASHGRAASPWCFARSWVCLDGVRPVRRAAEAPVVDAGADIFLTVDPGALGFVAGDTLALQAVLLDPNGRPWSDSPLLEVSVEPTVVGCTYQGSPDYDPTATLAGPCACPERLVATTAAELAPYAACTTLGEIDLSGFVDPVAELPLLEEVAVVQAQGVPGLEALRLPSWRGPAGAELFVVGAPNLVSVDLRSQRDGFVLVDGAPALTDLDLRSLEVGQLDIEGTGLSTLSLPALTLGDATFRNNPSFATFDAPVLEELSFGLLFDRSGPVGPLQLPALQRGRFLSIVRAPQLTHVDAPVMVSMQEAVALEDLPALVSVSLPALREVGDLVVQLTALSAVSLPALEQASVLYLRANPSLSSFSVPALGDTNWNALFQDNPALCVTAEPIFAAPPPGCTSAGIRNLCDP
jgi:hypothetical protein